MNNEHSWDYAGSADSVEWRANNPVPVAICMDTNPDHTRPRDEPIPPLPHMVAQAMEIQRKVLADLIATTLAARGDGSRSRGEYPQPVEARHHLDQTITGIATVQEPMRAHDMSETERPRCDLCGSDQQPIRCDDGVRWCVECDHKVRLNLPPMRGHDKSETVPPHITPTLPGETAAYIAKLEARVAELDEELAIGRCVVQLMGERIAELEAQRNTLTEACAAHNRVIGQQAAQIVELERQVRNNGKIRHARSAEQRQRIRQQDEIIRRLADENAALRYLIDEVRFPVSCEKDIRILRNDIEISSEEADAVADRDPGHDVLDAGRAVAGALAMPVLGGPVMWGTDDALDCE